jgi:D-tyrosyl-tRNA(Tyr) deacylase
MKAVIQRVKDAQVSVEGKITGSIKEGLLVYLGVAQGDTEKDADWLAEKTAFLRIFQDSEGKMNLSLMDLAGNGEELGVLAVSQFTLLGECGKGRRPYFGEAAEPELARKLYEYFILKIRAQGIGCEAGLFKSHMEVRSTNDGPVTILLDSNPVIQKT